MDERCGGKKKGWPSLGYGDWSETCIALHLWSRILGRYRLAYAPWLNHSWHATLYLTPLGLTTGPVHEPGGCVSLSLDLVDHRPIAEADGDAREGFFLTSEYQLPAYKGASIIGIHALDPG